ncbi:DUF397 domain-containing protein [Kitasatospora sp. NPDC054939]
MRSSDLVPSGWFTSSYSQQGGDCVEVAAHSRNVVPVRDSKDPEGPVLLFPADAWRSFITALRDDEISGA